MSILKSIVKREQIQLIPLMISHLTMFPLVMTAVKKLFMILIMFFIKIKNIHPPRSLGSTPVRMDIL